MQAPYQAPYRNGLDRFNRVILHASRVRGPFKVPTHEAGQREYAEEDGLVFDLCSKPGAF